MARHIEKFDLFQISQLAMFMTSPDVSPYIPDTLWTTTLQKSMLEAIENFKKYGD